MASEYGYENTGSVLGGLVDISELNRRNRAEKKAVGDEQNSMQMLNSVLQRAGLTQGHEQAGSFAGLEALLKAAGTGANVKNINSETNRRDTLLPNEVDLGKAAAQGAQSDNRVKQATEGGRIAEQDLGNQQRLSDIDKNSALIKEVMSRMGIAEQRAPLENQALQAQTASSQGQEGRAGMMFPFQREGAMLENTGRAQDIQLKPKGVAADIERSQAAAAKDRAEASAYGSMNQPMGQPQASEKDKAILAAAQQIMSGKGPQQGSTQEQPQNAIVKYLTQAASKGPAGTLAPGARKSKAANDPRAEVLMNLIGDIMRGAIQVPINTASNVGGDVVDYLKKPVNQ